MGVREAIRHVGRELHADVGEDADGTLWMEVVLARRRAGNLLKVLRYRVELDADPASHTVFFEEWLWEADAAGAVDLAARIGDREKAYRVSGAEAPGNVEQVAGLFAQRYGTEFDFPEVRLRLRDACQAHGYQLRHLIPL